jgi:hypothetical protein
MFKSMVCNISAPTWPICICMYVCMFKIYKIRYEDLYPYLFLTQNIRGFSNDTNPTLSIYFIFLTTHSLLYPECTMLVVIKNPPFRRSFSWVNTV